MKSMLRKLIIISLIGFFIMSLSFLLMGINSEKRLISVLTGVLFWAGLILGVATSILYAKKFKIWCQKYGRTMWLKKKPGILIFFSNTIAKAVDIVLFASLLLLILTFIITKMGSNICFAAIALFTMSFAMHCINI